MAVNVNKPNILKQVRPYINKRKYKFPVSVDPRSKLAKKLGVIGYPALYIVDKDGTIIYKSSGYEEGKEDEYLEKLIDYLISNTKKLLNMSSGKSEYINFKGKNVVVLGGGDTAMDCNRTAIRQGAKSVTCLYRRDEVNMPGSRREVKNAKEEGVIFDFNVQPIDILGNNKVEGVKTFKQS